MDSASAVPSAGIEAHKATWFCAPLAVLLVVGLILLLTMPADSAAESYREVVEDTSGVMHFWPMEESSGSSFGDTVGGADALVSGGVTLGEPGGLVGDSSTSVSFDGASGSAQAGVDLSGTHQLTVEFWMKWGAYASDDRLALEFTPNFNEYSGGFLIDPDATPGSDFAVSIGRSTSRNTVYFERPSAGIWHYYAFVIDTEAAAESQITPYVDGKAVSYTKSESGTGAGDFAESTLFWMSRDASGLFGAGSMQDLALYDSTLSAGVIAEHYEVGEGGPKASFVSSPVVASAGIPVRFDASGSSSPAGSVTDYAWDFDGGKSYSSDEGASATVSHTFSSPGTYTVDLRVKDSLGEIATVSKTIVVNAALGAYEQAVEKTAGVSHFWPMGESSGSSFADLVGGSYAEVLSGVALGEPGALVEDSSTATAFNGSSGAARAEVDLSGTHRLTVEFWMKWAAFAEDDDLAMELTPNFNEHPGGFLVDPDASGTERFGLGIGEGSSRNNAYFTRPSAEHWHYYAFTFDTTAAGADQITPYVDGKVVSYTKTAEGTEAGAFAKTVLYWMSRDASGLFGAGSMQDLALYDSTLSAGVIAEHYEVGEGGPKASFVSSPVVASAGVPVRFDASGSSSPAGSVIDYAWDFDGGKSYSSDEGASATVSHTFSSPGTYTVDLRVKDSLGEIATVSKTIVVNAALGAYEQAVEKTAGVSHFWPMGESSGSSFADAIAGDNAELTSGVTLGEAGGLVDDSATSALFDGSTGTAHAGVDLSSTHELTVEFWMKWGAYASDDRLALEFTPNFNEYSGGFLIDPDATPGSDFAVSIGRSTSRNTVYFERPSAGIWHYYAFVIDTEAAAETQITPYVDGHTMSYTKSESGTGSGDFANSTLYWMSRDASSLFGAGSMQDLAIYSTTISSSVVLEHYERGENTYMAANTTAPSIEGTLKDGLTLIASPGVWLGASPISYTYQWQSCNTAGGECQDITGATGKTYTLETTDIDTTVRVAVTASNPGGSVQATSAASTEVKAGAPSELEGPSISGTPDAGETLDGHAGNWGGSETMVSYQWEACNASGGECLDIAGANSLDYELSSGDVGDTLRLRVGVSNSLGSLTALSASTEVVGAVATLLNISVPSIVGTPQRGHTLTANAGSWLGATTISYTYVWHRCNYYGYACEAIAGATESTYTLGSEDTGHTLQVVVTASEASASTSETSPVTLVIAQEGAPIAEEHPTISGTGFVGYTLNAINGGWAGEEPLSYSYQWKRCDEYGESCSSITGATGSTYTLTESDAGGTIRVLVTAISSAGSTASSGAAVAVSPATLTKVSAPSVAGEDERGRPLSADPGIWTGEDEIAYSYQWQRCTEKGEACTDISGATEPFYTPGASDVGYALKVGVTASGTAGSESSASSLTPAITSPPTAPESQLTPSIEGNPTTGEALSAQPGWWLGSEPIAYTYQWQRCNPEGEECANILEATSETYLLTGADLGSTIQVTVTATNSLGDASATSHQSEAISAPGPPSSSKGPTIQGTAQEGKKIFATNGTWSGSRPLTYVYRWERCTAAGESCSAIEGATKPGYTVNSADLNSTLRIKVTVTNSDGTSSALSPLTIVSAAGEANTSEALEIAEATDPSILAASTTANIEEQSIKPVVEDPGEELSSSSAPTSSSISKETPGEFAVDTADSELSLQPISTSPAATKTPTVVNGAAALFAETSRATDTIVRPDALGVTTLLQLRSAEAPTTFSWEVGLGARQQLEELPGGSIAVTEPPSSSPIEGALSEESFGAPETKAAETGGSGVTAGAAEEELESFLGEESPLESLPSAPQVSTPTITPESGELHPQETRSQYEHDTTALASAKTASANKVLMVIEPPVVMDAVGHTVTASLSIKGNTVTLTISPSLEVTFPVTAATVVASAGEASSAPEPRYGLADKEPADFTTAEEEPGKTTTNFDKHLEVGPLHVKVARDYVPYNANAEVLIPWLEAVKKDKLEPYITFESPQNCTVGEPCAAENDPSIAQYSTGVERIISGVKRIYEENKTGKEIPEVKLWGAWNEPDFKSNAKYDPLYRSAWKAALFWKVARVALRTAGCSCTMVAGEFAEYTSYIQRYKETVLKNHTYWPRKPAVWGLHDYHDVVHAYQDVKHRGSTTVYRNPDAEKFTQALGKRVGHPHIMLSEQGVELENNSTASILLEGSPPEQEEHQRIAALDFLRLLSTSERRIELIDYYEYRGPSKEKIEKEHNPAYFDSALLHGSERHEALEPREAYCVIALGKEGCRPVTSSQEPVPGTTSSTGSTVVLEIDPRGLPTSYRVEYGVTTEYGQTSTATAVASSIGRQSEVVALTGLEPCTTYHYQAEAESPASEGSPSLGGDKTFQTPGCRLPALTVAVGGSFACAVLGDDGVDCWGDNEYGELGDGSTVNSETPVPVNGITSAVAIATGFDTACALLTDGGVDCWGDNEYGQLGNGTTTNSSVPVSVSGVNNAVAVSVGGDDSCALLTTGHVACWGRNDNGQLGNETVTDSATPVTVTGISSATAISAGYFSTCAVLADGGIECWGDNEWDELGYLGTTLPKSTKPVPTPEKGAASAVEAGFEHTCALLSGGGIECWGNTKIGTPYNGIFTEGRLTPSPVAVSGITDATRIAGYTFTTCSSLASGEVNCWGDDEYGQLGDNTTIPLFEGGSTTPVKVSGISDTIALSAGAGSICTLGSTGEIYCWGDNEDGELGDGGTENSSTPVSVTGIG